jgi:hypothetical protein
MIRNDWIIIYIDLQIGKNSFDNDRLSYKGQYIFKHEYKIILKYLVI